MLTQFVPRKGIIDLGWGHPDPDLLPVAGLRSASGRAMDRYGHDALAYGLATGPDPLINAICDRLSVTDAKAPKPDEVLVTAGNSHAIDQVATVLTVPGDVVHVESPTYHLAVRVLRDHPLDIIAVPTDDDGLRVDLLEQSVGRVRASGRRARLVYTVPTFHNPTGRLLAAERRRQLVDLAAAEDLIVVEDDVYRELSYDGPPPPSLWSLSRPGAVVRLGSFAKSLAPGIRVGYMTADPSTIRRFVGSGVLDSGGGYNHFAALMVAEFMAAEYSAHVVDLQNALRERRDSMLRSLTQNLPVGVTFCRPAGGYFVWVTLPSGQDASTLLREAEERGTSFVPGNVFYLDSTGGAQSLRLAFSRYPVGELDEAVVRLGRAIRLRYGSRA